MDANPSLSIVGDPGTHRGLIGRLDESLSDWTVRIGGEVERPCELTLAELKTMQLDEMHLKVSCVSAGAIYRPLGERARFTGICLDQIVKQVRLKMDAEDQPTAQAVRFISKAPGQCGPPEEPHDTSLEIGLCMTPRQVMLAWQLAGKNLPYENGGPLRAVVDGTAFDGKGRYFYKSLKWLGAIEFVDKPIEACPGTWERYAGYSVPGRIGDTKVDPFFRVTDDDGVPQPVDDPRDRFARMLSDGDLSRIVAAQLENVVGDFLSDPLWTPGVTFASGFQERDPAGTPRYRAAFRGTSFRGRDLRGWDFAYVNFSLSSFTGAILGDDSVRRAAIMRDCDMEGAVFYDADLRNVDMTNGYLTGARFCGDGGSKAANVEGLNVSGAKGVRPATAKWLSDCGAIGTPGDC